jgi:hypothetical protein
VLKMLMAGVYETRSAKYVIVRSPDSPHHDPLWECFDVTEDGQWEARETLAPTRLLRDMREQLAASGLD